jgi:lipoyl-dependent peroxiredoxin
MKRKASAVWQGGLKEGRGTLTTESGVLSTTPYSFSTRFEGQKGTNPEELAGAAHAGCFSMQLAALLEKSGMTADKIETEAAVTLEKEGEGFAITSVHLDVAVAIPGGDEAKFQEIAQKAKELCPISKLFNTKITMEAKLSS